MKTTLITVSTFTVVGTNIFALLCIEFLVVYWRKTEVDQSPFHKISRLQTTNRNIQCSLQEKIREIKCT